MKSLAQPHWRSLAIAAVAALIAPWLSVQALAQSLTAEQAKAIAKEAYVFGYPLVTMELTRRVLTNVESPTAGSAPMNQFIHMREYPTADFKGVTAPNADTLYSTSFLDLKTEPFVLQVPDMQERYYLLPMLDAYTNVFASPGKRTVPPGAHTYVIVGPEFKGRLPAGLEVIYAPTNLVWILGRIYSTGAPEDLDQVHKLQDAMTLTPLSQWGRPYSPPKGTVDPSIDMTKPPREQVNALDAKTFFNTLASLMADNKPFPRDAPVRARMARLGIVAGQPFDEAKLDPAVLSAIQSVPGEVVEAIKASKSRIGRNANGWIFSTDLGSYGTRYETRAAVAFFGLGANLAVDAIYPTASTDQAGQQLNGAHRYVIEIPPGGLPPVNGFWSLTMYDKDFFFFANPLNRYVLSERNKFKTNADGSITLYLQNTSPGPDLETNWLPAPPDDFNLMLRLYWPKQEVINGTWLPWPVRKIE